MLNVEHWTLNLSSSEFRLGLTSTDFSLTRKGFSNPKEPILGLQTLKTTEIFQRVYECCLVVNDATRSVSALSILPRSCSTTHYLQEAQECTVKEVFGCSRTEGSGRPANGNFRERNAYRRSSECCDERAGEPLSPWYRSSWLVLFLLLLAARCPSSDLMLFHSQRRTP